MHVTIAGATQRDMMHTISAVITQNNTTKLLIIIHLNHFVLKFETISQCFDFGGHVMVLPVVRNNKRKSIREKFRETRLRWIGHV